MTTQKTHTCQCTQCRKRSGALIAPWIDTTSSRVLWNCGSRPAAKTARASDLQSFSEFSATPGVYRGFCKRCGSPLTYRSEESPEELEITTGSVDGEVLAGEMGRVLGKASEGHFWCANFIEGVTDLERGKRFREGGEGGESEVVAGGE